VKEIERVINVKNVITKQNSILKSFSDITTKKLKKKKKKKKTITILSSNLLGSYPDKKNCFRFTMFLSP